MKKLLRREEGFTLIELLVVVAILGILAAVVVPNVSKFVGSGQTEAASTELQTVQAAVDAAIADNGLTILAAGTNVSDFATADLDPDIAATLFLYPDYMRVQTAGGGRTYSWDTTGLVSTP